MQATDSMRRKALKAIEGGTAASNAFVLRLYRRELLRLRARNIVIDGNPRDSVQTEAIVSFLLRNGFDKVACIVLDLPIAIARHRLALRRICVLCGRQSSDTWCATCNRETERRSDDSSPEALESKLTWFATGVLPALTVFGGDEPVVSLDATQPPSDLLASVATWLGSVGHT